MKKFVLVVSMAVTLFFVSFPVLAVSPGELGACKGAETEEKASECFSALAQQCAGDSDCLRMVELASVEAEVIRLRAQLAELKANRTMTQVTPSWSPRPMVYTHGTNPGACLQIHGFDGTGPDTSTAFTFKVNGEWAHIDGGGRVWADLDRDGLPEDGLVDVMDGGSAYFICDPYRRLEVELVQLDLNRPAWLVSGGANRVYVRNRTETRYFAHDPQAPPSRLSRKSGL